MNRFRHALFVSFGAIAIATIGVVPLAAAASRPSVLAHRAPACTTGGIDVWLDTNGSGTAGSVYYHLEFTNLSGHTCALSGYPTVVAVSLHGDQLGSAASRNVIHAPTTVTLAPGSSANAILQIAASGVYPPSRCGPTTAAGFRIALAAMALNSVPFPFPACTRAGPTYLHVEALTTLVAST